MTTYSQPGRAQCRCSRCVKPSASIEWGGDGVTHSLKPAVVVGGRYVVGENPTYRIGGHSYRQLGLTAGEVIMVGKIRENGDVVQAGGVGYYVDPRHLTPAPNPAPEPAAAPAVDDDLLTAVAREIYLSFGIALPPVNHAYMTAVLKTDAFQRLRAAWTAEAEAENVQQAFELVKLRAENASLREQVDGRDRDNDVAAEALQNAWRERDEARAELDQLHSWDGLMRLLAEHWPADVFGDGSTFSDQDDPGVQIVNLIHMVSKARATVERLRAAQPKPLTFAKGGLICGHTSVADYIRNQPQLPDVGPVQAHGGNNYTVDGLAIWADSADLARRNAACQLAVAAFLDAEAADTSSDDEVQELAKVLADADVEGFRGYGVMARAVIAHRARGGQEAGQ